MNPGIRAAIFPYPSDTEADRLVVSGIDAVVTMGRDAAAPHSATMTSQGSPAPARRRSRVSSGQSRRSASATYSASTTRRRPSSSSAHEQPPVEVHEVLGELARVAHGIPRRQVVEVTRAPQRGDRRQDLGRLVRRGDEVAVEVREHRGLVRLVDEHVDERRRVEDDHAPSSSRTSSISAACRRARACSGSAAARAPASSSTAVNPRVQGRPLG